MRVDDAIEYCCVPVAVARSGQRSVCRPHGTEGKTPTRCS